MSHIILDGENEDGEDKKVKIEIPYFKIFDLDAQFLSLEYVYNENNEPFVENIHFLIKMSKNHPFYKRIIELIDDNICHYEIKSISGIDEITVSGETCSIVSALLTYEKEKIKAEESRYDPSNRYASLEL